MLEKKITFDSFIRGIISVLIIIGILYLINYLSTESVKSSPLMAVSVSSRSV